MSEAKKLIVFRLGVEKYGVPIDQVISIERFEQMTRVPNAPTYVSGVINLRGNIIPVVDLKQKFHMGRHHQTTDERLIIVEVDDIRAGLLVDEAKDVVEIDLDRFDSPPEIIGGINAENIAGIAKIENDLLILLNLQRALNHGEVEEVKAIESQ